MTLRYIIERQNQDTGLWELVYSIPGLGKARRAALFAARSFDGVARITEVRKWSLLCFSLTRTRIIWIRREYPDRGRWL